jgi:hypothetical protein
MGMKIQTKIIFVCVLALASFGAALGATLDAHDEVTCDGSKFKRTLLEVYTNPYMCNKTSGSCYYYLLECKNGSRFRLTAQEWPDASPRNSTPNAAKLEYVPYVVEKRTAPNSTRNVVKTEPQPAAPPQNALDAHDLVTCDNTKYKRKLLEVYDNPYLCNKTSGSCYYYLLECNNGNRFRLTAREWSESDQNPSVGDLAPPLVAPAPKSEPAALPALGDQTVSPIPDRSQEHPGAAKTGQLTVIFPLGVPSDIAASNSVKLNERELTVATIDPNKNSVTLLGNDDPSLLPRGLNVIQTLHNQYVLWKQDRALEAFDQPYKTSFAVVAAIDDYYRSGDTLRRGPTGYAELENMVETARKLKSELIKLGFPKENIREYYNEQATSANMDAALRDFWEGGPYEGASRVFFYFGGHGDGEGGHGYLVTYDFDKKRPTQTSFLMSDFVARHFPFMRVHHLFVALESCSAGLAVPSLESGDADEAKLRRFATLANIRADVEGEARDMLVAGTGDEPAAASAGGLFTKALIEGLEGEADLFHDGIIRFDALGAYVRMKVVARAAALGVKQEPKTFKATAFGNGSVVFPLAPRD